MKTNALVGEAASFYFVVYVFSYLKMKLLQQNKRYSKTHDLKGNAHKIVDLSCRIKKKNEFLSKNRLKHVILYRFEVITIVF